MTGLRIANVAELEIGHTLLLRDKGGVDILIPRGSVKNRTPFTADLPWVSARLLREYIRLYRPLLGDAASPWLFPGARPATHKSTSALRAQVTEAMAGVVGVAWNPHLFRHLLAHLELDENPGADGLVTRALGHKRADTTRAHYAGFKTKAAIRQHDELVLRRRAATQAGHERRRSSASAGGRRRASARGRASGRTASATASPRWTDRRSRGADDRGVGAGHHGGHGEGGLRPRLARGGRHALPCWLG